MAGYIHFTDEQKYRANSVDLVDFLERQGEHLIRAGREWRWKRHDSVTIKGNQWFRHSVREGGGAISFVQKFYDKGFPAAVSFLLGGEHGADFKQSEEKPVVRKPFALPEANATMRRVYAYLIKQRFIDSDVISHFVHERKLYEDKEYHNAIFVGLDENGVAKHAHKKGTYSDGKSYRGNVEGSLPEYSFNHIGTGDTLYVFESPIDMLSYITLSQDDWQQHSYLTLNGVTDKPLLHFLSQYLYVKSVCLCLDNDKAGLETAARISAKLVEMGYIVSEDIPEQKDWNDELKYSVELENELVTRI